MKMIFQVSAALLFLFGCSPRTELTGRVVKISDGDTFTFITPMNESVKVRLYGIDAPEKGQDYFKVSKQFLSDLIYNQTVTVIEKDIDQYGRTVAIVITAGDTIVNEALLQAGLAWHYKQYDYNVDWAALEQRAQEQNKGIWTIPNATPPWEFRKSKRKSRHRTKSVANGSD